MIKWLGTLAGMVGAALVASNTGFQFLGYISFFTGSAIWLFFAVKENDKAAAVQWVFFTAMNIMGIIQYA